MFAFPRILKVIPDLNVGLAIGTTFLTLALAAVPAGTLAQKLGNRRSMLLGLIGIALTLGAMIWVQRPLIAFGVAIALGASLSLVQNGTLPFALSMVPVQKAGLGIGMFFSGAALASNLFGAFFKQTEALTPTAMIAIAIGSWLVGMVAISFRPK